MAPRKKDETAATEQMQLPEEQALVAPPAADAPAQPPESNEQGPASPDAPEPPRMVRALFLTNVKHNLDYYDAGQKNDLPEDVFVTLMRAKAVRLIGE
ncbi:hypothetical protein FE784_00740 [Paenibacillus hemerocallicola]|uniref:Uncharacterized protein n=1 Tax=Paenibacillus hemerocallicola TaxID=1172614 RepID=A0A5C4TIC8_9BACL|nr:hypothetical protein [Paenibacillus hemerocallicola]TNJ68220.1 hypothetical protein FE784_00740 [Paenibacillus hemerocallicola]